MTTAKGGGGCRWAPASRARYADCCSRGTTLHVRGRAGGAAAANAVLEVVDDEPFLSAWSARVSGSPAVCASGARRPRAGLMLAFACEDGPGLSRRLLLEQRLVTNATGPDTVRLLPPLTVSDEELDEAARRIGRVIAP